VACEGRMLGEEEEEQGERDRYGRSS
jgi:hypothetical protein